MSLKVEKVPQFPEPPLRNEDYFELAKTGLSPSALGSKLHAVFFIRILFIRIIRLKSEKK